MNEIIENLNNAFLCDSFPSEDNVVIFDGYDQLEKEDIKKEFLGKSQDEILSLIKSGKFGNCSMQMEWLQSMEVEGIRYYLYPFLIYLAEGIESNDQQVDEEFSFWLFAKLGNILKDRGLKVFTEVQLEALKVFVNEILKYSATLEQDDWMTDALDCLKEVKDLLN